MKSRVAIFFWEGYLGVAPSLINGAIMLADAGYGVDIIMPCNKGDYAQPPSFPPDVRILYPVFSGGEHKPAGIGEENSREHVKASPASRSPLRNKLATYKGVIQSLLGGPRNFIKFGLRCTKEHRYACFIGVDMYGLVAATVVGAFRRVPVIYWSLELMFVGKIKDPVMRAIKNLEKICHRAAKFTIIQDMERARCLLQENKVKISEVVVVPNSPLGRPHQSSGTYFHKKFNLQPSQKVILHIGWIAASSLSLELAKAASAWPDEWRLIFHERQRRDPREPYLKDIQAAGGGRVLLSLEPVPYDQMDLIVSSAAMGIILCGVKDNPNFSLMQGASGKYAQYLRCSLPVISVGFNCFTTIIDEYQCGISVKRVEDAKPAIEKILQDIEPYRRNAIRCYEEKYEFGKHFKNVIDKIVKFDAKRKEAAHG